MNYQLARRHIDTETLWSQADVLQYLKENDATYSSLYEINNSYQEIHAGKELQWHYPLCDGEYQGAYLLPVKEGFLYLPYYDCLSECGYEQFNLEGAHLCGKDELRYMCAETMTYAAGLVKTLRHMQEALVKQRITDESKRGE